MQTPKIPQILISFVRLLSHTAVQMWQCGTPHLEKTSNESHNNMAIKKLHFFPIKKNWVWQVQFKRSLLIHYLQYQYVFFTDGFSQLHPV